MQKIILFYKFTPIADTEMARLWQLELCYRLSLKGRIIISTHGINGTLGGSMDNVKAYCRAMNKTTSFKSIAYKWSDGTADNFPKLSIKVRDEIVTFGAPDEIKVNQQGIVGGGTHLKPNQLHELVESRGDEVVFFDGRNKLEAEVGRFKNAVVPDTANTRDFIQELDSGKYDDLKDKPVVTYCTGGIRCEVLSVLMKNRGFNEVYQLDGGIVKYGETYGDEGLWEGALYVFDGRLTSKFSDKAKDIGMCYVCSLPTSSLANCADMECNSHKIVCDACTSDQFLCTSNCQATATVK